METTTKICGKCRRELPVSEFYKASNRKDGYQSVCKECTLEYHRKKAEAERPASTDGGGRGGAGEVHPARAAGGASASRVQVEQLMAGEG